MGTDDSAQGYGGYQTAAAAGEPGEIEMPPMDLTHRGHSAAEVVDEPALDVVRERAIRDKVVAEARRRLDEDLILFNTAMSNFYAHAQQMAGTLPDGHAEFTFWTVLEALQPAFFVLFPVEGVAAEFAKELIKGGIETFEGGLKSTFESSYGERRAAAKERLFDAASSLVTAANHQALQAWEHMKGAGLVDAANEALSQIDSEGHLVTDEWAGWICDNYLGVPEPTVRKGHDDIRAKLEEQFAGVYWMIDNELRDTGRTPEVVRGAATQYATEQYRKEGDVYWDEETKDARGE